MSIIRLRNISVSFGGPAILEKISLSIDAGERVCLLGRNGMGKSTLMKVMAGLVAPDSGTRVVPPGVGVGYMEQDPEMSGFATLGDFAARDLEPGEDRRVEAAAEGIGVNLALDPANASGGERRRAALARVVASEAGLLLLDEPTEGLDAVSARRVLATVRRVLPDAAIVIATHKTWEVAQCEREIRIKDIS